MWHNVKWDSGKDTFKKVELTPEEREKLRLGNNFYPVNYVCPDCGDKLFMVVYPTGKEFRIETDESPVYMARGYTCGECHHFYTPKPHKLLVEGDVYHLNFEEDKVAYEDYLELLGRQGERTSNSNFNFYELEYNKKDEPTWEENPAEENLEENELQAKEEKKRENFKNVRVRSKTGLSFRERAELGEEESYASNLRLLQEVEKDNLPEGEKDLVLKILLGNLERSGTKELNLKWMSVSN